MQNRLRIAGGVLGIAGLCWLGAGVLGQTYSDAPQYVQYPDGPPVTPAAPAAQVTLNSQQLDQLLAPIALYPDPLLSLILPAATFPDQVAAAEQWLTSTPSPTESAIDAQSWDASIKGLVHYPTVLKMMNDQMDWTQALGAAFLNQQPDVMASVQRLRNEAKAAGNLQNTPQTQVVDSSGEILIEPVNPDTVYVPEYDPDVVYTSPYSIDWGVGYPLGLWDDNGFDWGGGYLAIGGGWWFGWNHPADWDRHPPTWFHGAHWGTPQRWNHAGAGPRPFLTPSVVTHLGLDRPPGARGPVRVTPSPIGREPAARPTNAFEPVGNRADVQRAVERAHPAPPAAVQRPVEVRPAPAPHYEAPRVEAPRVEAPRVAAPQGAFGGGGGAAARAASARGHASGGGRR